MCSNLQNGQRENLLSLPEYFEECEEVPSLLVKEQVLAAYVKYLLCS